LPSDYPLSPLRAAVPRFDVLIRDVGGVVIAHAEFLSPRAEQGSEQPLRQAAVAVLMSDGPSGSRQSHDERVTLAPADLPAIGFALPVNSENRWSDFLAVLVATDPLPLCRLLGLESVPDGFSVEREVAVDSANRPDLVLRTSEGIAAVVEVKVLAGLGAKQLERYVDAEPDADNYAVVFPERLVVDVSHAPGWQPLTWEMLLDEYALSVNLWVRTCAEAWRRHLDESLPKVDGSTRWNDLSDGEGFVVAMRARASWIFSNLRPPAPIEHDLVVSSAGASSVVRLVAPAAVDRYLVMADLEERLNVRNIPKYANALFHPPHGPSIRLALLQEGVTSSKEFDWDYLLALWPLMRADRDDWVTRSASPRSDHDRANHQAMVAKGGPKYLGVGFGEAQARITGQCLFGLRLQLPPDITLAEAVATLTELSDLLLRMAALDPNSADPSTSGDGNAAKGRR